MNVYDILNLLGGIALFLFGMHTLSASLEKLAGGKLETWLEKATSKPIKGVVLGAIITAVIQSSAATTVMIIGFVNSGLMKLSQAIGVIMGANIGTTATSWLLSLQSISGSDGFSFLNLLKPTTFTPVLAVIGVILIMFTKSDKKKTIGMILAGFAVLMFGMNSMSSATAGLAENETFCNILMMFSNPVLGVVAGAVLTAVLQSSSASIGILQSIAISTGKVTYSVALPLLLGQNIGSCVTALISSVGANKPAKRVAFVHLYFNVIGTVVFLSIFYLLNAFISMPFMEESLNAVGIAVIHTGFNVLATALFLPFTKQLENRKRKLMEIMECEITADGKRKFNPLYRYEITENRMEGDRFIINGTHKKVCGISESLKKRFLENGMPKDVLERIEKGGKKVC